MAGKNSLSLCVCPSCVLHVSDGCILSLSFSDVSSNKVSFSLFLAPSVSDGNKNLAITPLTCVIFRQQVTRASEWWQLKICHHSDAWPRLDLLERMPNEWAHSDSRHHSTGSHHDLSLWFVNPMEFAVQCCLSTWNYMRTLKFICKLYIIKGSLEIIEIHWKMLESHWDSLKNHC